MAKLSVYGAGGFVGSNFVKMFPDDTRAIPREQDMSFTPEILYLISTTHNYHIFDNPFLDVQTNLTKLLKVLTANKALTVVNFVSSWFVYGKAAEGRKFIKEEDPCDPRGFYSITKRAAEQMLISWCETFNIKYRILRLCNVIGVGDKGASAKKNALLYLIQKLCRNEPIDLYEGGHFIRDYAHVEDICRALKLVTEKGEYNTVYNIGNGKELLFKDLINFAVEYSGSKSVINHIEQKPYHKQVQVRDITLDTGKLQSLGYKPQKTIYDAIKDIIDDIKKS